MIKQNYKPAFTLAEVLVTLAIIGVVASLTIPSLVKSYQEAQCKAAFKKQYSVLSAAVKNMMLSYDSTTMQGLPITLLYSDFADRSGLKILKRCSYIADAQTSGCMPSKWYGLEGMEISNIATYTSGGMVLMLVDGSTIILEAYDSECDWAAFSVPMCSYMYVDVNGPKGPNITGIDIYFVFITKDGLVPGGAINNSLSTWLPCSRVDDGSYPNGRSCAAKVLQNLDY